MQVRKNFNLPENATIPAVVATMLHHPDWYRPRVEFTRQRMAAKQLDLRDMEIAMTACADGTSQSTGNANPSRMHGTIIAKLSTVEKIWPLSNSASGGRKTARM